MSAHQRVTVPAENTHETLEIVNPTILRLVTEVSERTGETSETVIETALLERLERLQTGDPHVTEAARLERVNDAVKDLRDAFRNYPEARVDHAALLYGDDGLPK